MKLLFVQSDGKRTYTICSLSQFYSWVAEERRAERVEGRGSEQLLHCPWLLLMTQLTRQWERGLQVKYTVGVVRPRGVFADLVNFFLFFNLTHGFL